MTTPNLALRAVRIGARLSQDDLARRLREMGAEGATKRMVQRWEAGESAPRPGNARALERALGLPLASLGFSIDVPGDDLSGQEPLAASGGAAAMPAHAATVRAQFSGIWLSRYEYHSSGRGQTLTAAHYVLVLQHGAQLTVRSLPGASTNADSPLSMDLTVDGQVVTGTWVEQTAPDGYYRGARYHGAIQMIVEPTGRRMRGKWIGFGAEMDINSGPWEMLLQDASTSQTSVAAHSRVPEI